jgi:hypothetical protein
MRYGYIILLAAVLSLAAVLVATVPALAGNATVAPSSGQAPQSDAPIKIWPRPLAEMPAASSPAVQLPTAKPTPTPTPTGGTAGTRNMTNAAADAYVARVTDSGLVAGTISPGGVISGYVVIQNNGNDPINDARVHVAVMKPRENGHSIAVMRRDVKLYNVSIAPGSQKRVEFSIGVPETLAAGSYNIQTTVLAGGQQINTFSLPVTVT